MEADEWIRYCDECGAEMNEDNENEECKDEQELINQVRRLMAERDLLLSAISETDYAKIQTEMDAISTSPDETEGK